MCTLTLFRSSERILLTMNRDERRERAAELAPSWHAEPAQWLGPLDGQAGGTWCGVNSRGVMAALLNDYASPAQEAAPSRGLLIPSLLRASTASAAREALSAQPELNAFNPFWLICADADSAWIAHHAGSAPIEFIPAPQPWAWQSSSSWNQAEVIAWRRERFNAWLKHPDYLGSLPNCHLDQPPQQAAWSARMERDYAATRSITQIELSLAERRGEMRYWLMDGSFNAQAPASLTAFGMAVETADCA